MKSLSTDEKMEMRHLDNWIDLFYYNPPRWNLSFEEVEDLFNTRVEVSPGPAKNENLGPKQDQKNSFML